MLKFLKNESGSLSSLGTWMLHCRLIKIASRYICVYMYVSCENNYSKYIIRLQFIGSKYACWPAAFCVVSSIVT